MERGVRGQTWYLDDIPTGYVHRFGDAEVLEADIELFESRFGPALPIHAGAAATGAPQGLVFALWTRLVWEETRSWPILAHLGQDAVRWYGGVAAGDRLSVRLSMTGKESTAADRGLLFAQHEVTNQRGDLVLSLMTRTILARRPAQ